MEERVDTKDISDSPVVIGSHDRRYHNEWWWLFDYGIILDRMATTSCCRK